MGAQFVEVIVYLAIAIAVVVVLYVIARVSGVYSSDIDTAKRISEKSKDGCVLLKKDTDKFLKKQYEVSGYKLEKEQRNFKVKSVNSIKKLMRSTARLGRCVHMYDDNSNCAIEIGAIDGTIKKIQKTYYAAAKLVSADNYKVLGNCLQNVLKLYEKLATEIAAAETALQADISYLIK